MKKDAYYFTHDSNASDDPRIMVMVSEWGLEAYGIYWTLIEHLRNQGDYKSHISILKPLSMRYNSSEEKYKAVVFRYGLFIVEDDVFYSISLINRMRPLEEKRLKMIELANKRWSHDAYALPSQSVGNASKVKESKVKESKEEESKVSVPPSIEDVKEYFKQNGYGEELAVRAFNYYSEAKWKDSKGKQVKNWKQKMIGVWFKEENKVKQQPKPKIYL